MLINDAKVETPYRTRKDMTDFILQSVKRRHSPFSFYVKMPHLDLSLKNLLAMYREKIAGETDHLSLDWLQKIATLYAETNKEYLYEDAVQRARQQWVGYENDGGPCEEMRTLPNGKEVKVRYEFQGRDSGWLAIAEFEGHRFGNGSAEPELADMDFTTLRRFYQLISAINAELDSRGPERAVTYFAAWHFFMCDPVCEVKYEREPLATAEQEKAIVESFPE